jgi:hypothetical protein
MHFEIVGAYTVKLKFEDGTEQRINFEPVLHGIVFGPLRDVSTFNAVSIDPEAGTLTWPNGADFDPATLHDWPNVCRELEARAEEWAKFAAPNISDDMAPMRR